jgi:hypothetical protein
MERKIFWTTFTILGLMADFILPLWWALGATIPIGGLPIAAVGSEHGPLDGRSSIPFDWLTIRPPIVPFPEVAKAVRLLHTG